MMVRVVEITPKCSKMGWAYILWQSHIAMDSGPFASVSGLMRFPNCVFFGVSIATLDYQRVT